ncbi:flagellum-specific ATP synthase FliI, partial [Methylobacterium sp. WL122]
MTQDQGGTAARTLSGIRAGLERVEPLETYGRVVAIRGLLVEVAGPVAAMRLGGRLDVE